MVLSLGVSTPTDQSTHPGPDERGSTDERYVRRGTGGLDGTATGRRTPGETTARRSSATRWWIWILERMDVYEDRETRNLEAN